MFPSFLELPTVLKIQLVRKCQAIPYVRFRRTCRSVDQFCEKHRRSLKIYIYRRAPKLCLLNSMKNTDPFKKQASPDDAEITEPLVVVDYGRNHGDSNLKMPLNLNTLDVITSAISGFNFPALAVLNYCADDDEEGNRVFSAAFDLFLRVVHGLKPRRIELKNVTVEQFDTLATKWTLRNVLLKQSKKNMELVQNKLINSLACFYCHFDDNYSSANIVWSSFFNRNMFALLSWPRDAFDWTDLEYILKSYHTNYQTKLEYGFLFHETIAFYDLDLTTVRGNVIPPDGLYLGQFELKGVDFLRPNDASSWAGKRDFWLMDYENMEEAYFLTILRDDFFRSTMVQVDMKYIGVNDSFVCCLEEILRPGPVLDYSVLYERLIKLDTVKQKRDETIGFIESIVEIYGQT